MSEQQTMYFIGQLQARCNEIYKELRKVKEKIAFLEGRKESFDSEAPAEFGIGEAIRIIKEGGKVSRRCWNNPNIFFYLFKPTDREREDFIVVRTVAGFNVPWCPNHNELLAEDWYKLENKESKNDLQNA